MPAPPSQTRMCNEALILLGSSARIGSIDEGSPLARLFEDTWDQARDETLIEHPWNFALERADLPASGDHQRAGEYAHAYELPGDCLRWLPWRPGHPDHFDGEQEGRFILSSASAPIIVRFIRRIEDVGRWSESFKQAMTAKLAWKNAKAITGQSGMIDRMAELYHSELQRGRRQDGLASGDRNRRYRTGSNWLAARRRPAR